MSKKRKQKTRAWYEDHISDPYVQESKRLGLRSRASLKLQQIHKKLNLIKPHAHILDLGASPGGWSQMARIISGNQATIVALDMLPMEPIEGVHFLQGDFEKQETQQKLILLLKKQPLDLILSDIAPTFVGVAVADQLRSISLCSQVLQFSRQWLSPKGSLVMKVFQGEGFDALLKEARASFSKVRILKPEASRSRSKEQYFIGTQIKKLLEPSS